MKVSVFLSYPKPCNTRQDAFLKMLTGYLDGHGFLPRTLGVTDYDMDAPLKAVRRLMLECNGLITLAFRRTYIESGASRYGTDLPGMVSHPVDGQWTTSPWSHIEPAMAYQLGLPILIFREKGVLEEGILDKGVAGLYIPEFDLDGPLGDHFGSSEWHGVIGKWEGHVRSVVDHKGNPPNLY